jgi:glycosyl transferase family 25
VKKDFAIPAHSQNSTDTWPVFVITLEGDEGRRQGLIDQLTKDAIDHELVFGVDGRQGLPKEFEPLIDRQEAKRRYRRALSDTEFACALSHQSIYRRLVDGEYNGAVILEDDAILTQTFVAFIAQRIYLKSDLMMLDHSHARVTGEPIHFADGILARKLALPSCRTTAYSVSTKAAEYLLNAGVPLADVADWPGDITTLDAVALDPTVVKHSDPDEGGSHIRASRRPAKSDLLRFLGKAYWRTWIKKRLSDRIS